MKGLIRIPTTEDLLKAYNYFQGNPKLEEKKLALASQWCRWEARLAEILVLFISKNWSEINPTRLNKALNRLPWPMAMGPLLESSGLLTTDKTLFSNWKICVMTEIPPTNNELFFFPKTRWTGHTHLKEVQSSLGIYEKWGYYGSEVLINKEQDFLQRHPKTLMKQNQRMALLNEYIKEHSELTVEDYLELVSFRVHRRVAQMDLVNHPRLRQKGYTQNRKYIVTR